MTAAAEEGRPIRSSSRGGSHFTRDWVRARRRRRRAVLGGTALAVLVVAGAVQLRASYPSAPAAALGVEANEALEHTNGIESLRFRHQQQVDERGQIPPNALLDAAAHVDLMRGRRPSGRGPAIAGISPGGWEWLGPGNIGGRIRSILIHPTAPDTMWVGSVTGGIFKTTNGGASWAHLDDFMSNLAVSSLVAHPSTPNTIYAGTGEYMGWNIGAPRGAGVFKSTDGGASWSHQPTTVGSNWWFTNRLAVHPANPNMLLAATSTGIFRTVNSGTNWSPVSTGGSIPVIYDVDFDPTNGANAIASGYGRALYTTNGGDSWLAAGGLPTGGRVEITYAPSNPTITYAHVDIGGGEIYKSVNGGQSYVRAGPTPDFDYIGSQGHWNNALWVSPSNPDHVIVGGLDLYRSVNGGATLTRISNWIVNQDHVRTGGGPSSAHADHHAMVAHPSYPGNPTVFFTNDGGVFKANPLTVTETAGWQELNNNLGVTQFYGGAGSAVTGKLVGGTQDNGTLRYNSATETWNMYWGGDGGFNAVDPTDANYVYGENQWAQVFRSTNGGASLDGYLTSCIKADPYKIQDVCDLAVNFIAPFLMDPNNPQRLLLGGKSLWRTNDARAPLTPTTGPAWTAIAPSHTYYISAIAIDENNSDLVYIGRNNGDIYRSTNATAPSPTWTQVDLASMPGRTILDLTIDPTNSNVVYAVFGGFSADNVWQLSDGNMSWTERTGSGATGLPDVPVRSLVVNPVNPSWIYVGTEVGVFASEDAGSTWKVPADGPANVAVDDIFMMGDNLVAATHGRGMFRANLAVTTSFPGTPTGVSAIAFQAQAFVHWTPPTWSGSGPLTGYVVTPYVGTVAQTPTHVGNVTTTPITGLTNGTTYTFKVAAKNASGTGAESSASNPVTPFARRGPNSVVIVTGSLGSGSAASLLTDDNSYLSVISGGSGTAKAASWYGVSLNVPNALTTLRVTYKGKSSRSCPQTIAVRNFTSGTWTTLDRRTVSTAEVEAADLVVPGAKADYVSGGAGNGEVWVRVTCSTRGLRGGFVASGDLLEVIHD